MKGWDRWGVGQTGFSRFGVEQDEQVHTHGERAPLRSAPQPLCAGPGHHLVSSHLLRAHLPWLALQHYRLPLPNRCLPVGAVGRAVLIRRSHPPLLYDFTPGGIGASRVEKIRGAAYSSDLRGSRPAVDIVVRGDSHYARPRGHGVVRTQARRLCLWPRGFGKSQRDTAILSMESRAAGAGTD